MQKTSTVCSQTMTYCMYIKPFTADVTSMIYTFNVKAPSEYREPVCPLRELKWTSSSIIVLTICVLLIALVIMGTMVDVSLWFVDDILPKLYISELDSSEQTIHFLRVK